jgi:hypothetical protein
MSPENFTTFLGVQAGDVGFAHTKGMMGKLIRLGETFRFKKWSAWNHEFVVDRVVDGVPYIIQATLRGVTDSAPLADVAPGGRYTTMAPPDGVDRHEFLVFCRSQVGMHYSLGTILAIAIDIVTWDWFPAFRGARKPSWICSALVNEGLRYGGWLHQWRDIYSMTPAEGYGALVH